MGHLLALCLHSRHSNHGAHGFAAGLFLVFFFGMERIPFVL